MEKNVFSNMLNHANNKKNVQSNFQNTTNVKLTGEMTEYHIDRELDIKETQTIGNTVVGALGVLGIIGAILCIFAGKDR